MAMAADVIVVGAGLAGAVLTEALRARGLSTLVFDVPKPYSASNAAAGVVNPLSMRRTIPVWRAEQLLQKAEAFYMGMEAQSAVRLWHPLSLVRLFTSGQERVDWQQRRKDPASGRFMEDGPVPGIQLDRLNAQHGYGVVMGCAWLDVGQLLSLHRSIQARTNAWEDREVVPGDVQVGHGLVQVHGATAKWLVWCTGAFAGLAGMVPTRGDVLGFTDEQLQCSVMVHRGGFLLPIGSGRYRVGSTFAWDEVWSGTSESGRSELQRKLTGMLIDPPRGPFEFACGVRPATRDRRPLLGQVAPRQFVFNGLGARGVLLAPWCAEHLIDHMINGAPLDPEVEMHRFGTA